ncbi:MAG: pitrilysin family protein [Bacteroidota bacterium]|nr:insulinase family protein [Candidatus Kapabacteria bacterium]MCX7937322.1 insulinase family protein [Chlorobiota bacterium]MDW8271520.1 pitrilysin family protein [Bacteroidota bacterium]
MQAVPRLDAPSYRFPEPTVTTTSRGARILLLPMPTATTVTIGAMVTEGSATEPELGMAHVVAALLSRGTRRRSEAEFVAAIDRLGASYNATATRRSISACIVGLPEHLPQLVELLAESILEPAFDEAELEKVRTFTLASFPVLLADASYRARRIFQKLRYPGHPYGRPPQGTPATVARISATAIRQWYDHLRTRCGWRIIVIGAFTPDKITAQLEQQFGALCDAPRTTLPPPSEPSPAIGIGQSVLTEQVELRLGHGTVPYTSPDYAATLLIATAFAGHFRSRVNLLLREQEGLTYGAYGMLMASKSSGTFSVATSTTPPNVSRAMDLLLEQWRRLAIEPFSEEELHHARQYLFGNFWRSVETPDAVASIAIELALNDLPPDFYTHLFRTMATLTPDDLLPVQQRVFDPAQLLVAAVGDQDMLAHTLAAYGTPVPVLLEEEQQ